MQFMQYMMNLFFVIPIVLLLFFIAVKLGKISFVKIGSYNHVSILEKANINKDTYLLVVKIGKEGCVGISSPSGFSTLRELSCDEILEIEKRKNDFLNQNNIVEDLKNKMNINKIKKDEKGVD